MTLPTAAVRETRGDSLQRFARVAGAASLAIGVLALVGWTFDIRALKSVAPGWSAMKANAALEFVLCGAALVLASGDTGLSASWRRRSVQLIALLVVAIGGATLVELLTGRNLGIDQFLFTDPGPMEASATPGRMAPQSAGSFALVGLVLLMRSLAPVSRQLIVEGIAMLPVLFIGTLGVTNYAYSVPAGGAMGGFSPLPLPTSLGLMLLGTGALAMRGAPGLFGMLVSDAAGGRVARRMLPWMVLAPLAVGWIVLQGERSGLYSDAFGDNLFAAVNVMLLSALLWWSARSVGEADVELTRSTQELEISAARSQRLFEDSPVALYRTSPSGTVLAANASLARLLGYPSGEALVGSQARDRYADPAVRDQFRMEIDRLGAVEGYVTALKRPDGSTFWAVDTSVAVRGVDGRVMHYEGCLVDITEQRVAEQRLLASEQRFRALIEQSSAGIALTDRTGSIQYSSPALHRILGWRPEDREGRPFAELLHPEHIELAATAMRQVMATSGAVASIEARARHANGEWRWIEATATNLLDDASVGAVVINYRDVTERKVAEAALRESEARFRQMAEHINEAFIIAELDTFRPIYVSPMWGEIWGRPIESGYDAQVRSDAIHPDDRAAVTSAREQLVQGTPSVNVFRIIRPDGTIRWIRSRNFPVRDATGKVYRMVGVSADVTELRQAEERFIQAQRMEAVGRLAGGVAHDFNNLLTVIIGGAETVLGSVPAASEAAEILTELRQAADSAVGLTRQLLTFSRRQLVEPVVFDVNDVVTSTANLLRRLIGEDIRLETHLEANAGAVRADRGQVEQVLTNLAVNARDAMPRGGVLAIASSRATLDQAYATLHADAVPGEFVQLTVSDTGSGMSRDVISHAFEPFFTTKDPGKGTGLGLATCHGIVKQAGGHITVYSEPGVGTTFRIYLPRIAATAEAAAHPSAALQRGNEHVLVVEDDPAVRRVAIRMLTRAGYHVASANDAEQALKLLAEPGARPDILFTDIVLPGLGGRELAEAAHALHPGLRVLFTTGYTDDVIIKRQLIAHDVVVLQKPYTAEQLTRKLREVLDAA